MEIRAAFEKHFIDSKISQSLDDHISSRLVHSSARQMGLQFGGASVDSDEEIPRQDLLCPLACLPSECMTNLPDFVLAACRLGPSSKIWLRECLALPMIWRAGIALQLKWLPLK